MGHGARGRFGQVKALDKGLLCKAIACKTVIPSQTWPKSQQPLQTEADLAWQLCVNVSELCIQLDAALTRSCLFGFECID